MIKQGLGPGRDGPPPSPVLNLGLDFARRSVQRHQPNIDHRALTDLLCQSQSTNTACRETALPGWITDIFMGLKKKKSRLEVCGVRSELSELGQRWKNVCGMSIIISSTRELGLFLPEEKPAPLPPPLCNTQVLICLPSWRL